jgi:hypothetical protein
MENNLRKKYNFTGPTTEEYTGRTPSISLYIYTYIFFGQSFPPNWVGGIFFNLVYKSDMCPFF